MELIAENIRSVFIVDPLKLKEIKEAPIITIHERNIVKDLTEIITPFDQSKATDIELMYCPLSFKMYVTATAQLPKLSCPSFTKRR